MDPFPEESSAFDADPIDTLPTAQDLVADSIDAEAEQPSEPAPDNSSSTMPAVFLMGAPSEQPILAAAPLPDLVDSSPLRFVFLCTFFLKDFFFYFTFAVFFFLFVFVVFVVLL